MWRAMTAFSAKGKWFVAHQDTMFWEGTIRKLKIQTLDNAKRQTVPSEFEIQVQRQLRDLTFVPRLAVVETDKKLAKALI